MSIETHFLLRNDRPVLQDLDSVVLLGPTLTHDGDRIEAGAQGTIVGVFPGARAYMVEFSEPRDALATVPGSALTRADPAPK